MAVDEQEPVFYCLLCEEPEVILADYRAFPTAKVERFIICRGCGHQRRAEHAS